MQPRAIAYEKKIWVPASIQTCNKMLLESRSEERLDKDLVKSAVNYF